MFAKYQLPCTIRLTTFAHGEPWAFLKPENDPEFIEGPNHAPSLKLRGHMVSILTSVKGGLFVGFGML